MEKRNVPKLRFKGFSDEWEEKRLKEFLVESRIPGSNGSKAKKLTVKLWAKGIVPKKEIHVGSDNTKYYMRREGQLMYGKLDFLNCAFGIVPKELDGYESTVDAPAFDIKNINSCFLLNKIIQKNFYKKYGDIADGSRKAKRIHSDIFLDMSIKVPSLEEQERIGNFFSIIDKLIEEQEGKVRDLELYKKGMMQKIFKQEIRFKDDNGLDYPAWEEKKLGDVLTETKARNTGELKVCSVAVKKGVVDQIEHLGRSFASKNTKNYKLVKKGDLIYTKSPTGQFPYGIVKQSFLDENVIVSPLYGVFEPINYFLGYILHSYFYYKENMNNYLHSIVQKGAKNTMNIANETFLSKKVRLPISLEEQIKIANFLSNIDNIIEEEKNKLEDLKLWKKGLLQQMFV